MGVAEQHHKASFSPSYVPDTTGGITYDYSHFITEEEKAHTIECEPLRNVMG